MVSMFPSSPRFLCRPTAFIELLQPSNVRGQHIRITAPKTGRGTLPEESALAEDSRPAFGCLRRVHFPRVEWHDRFWGGHKPVGKVTSSSEEVL